MKPKEHLYLKWKFMISVAVWKGQRSEDVFIEPFWIEFDGFYKANRDRYYRAKRKWKNYKYFAHVYKEPGYRQDLVSFTRKVKSLGYTKENTVFTSLADRMKYYKGSKQIIFANSGALLGTRDVSNLLRKKGITLSVENVNARINRGADIFQTNRLAKYKWKGKYMSLGAVCEKEKIAHTVMGNRIYHDKLPLKKAIELARKSHRNYYQYKGKKYSITDLLKVLSRDFNIKITTLENRFYRFGYDLDKMINLPENKFNPSPKKVVLCKNGMHFKFDSIRDASKFVNRNRSGLSMLLNHGRGKTIAGYTAYFDKEKTDIKDEL